MRVLAAESGDVVRLRGVDPRGDEPLIAGESGDRPLGAAGVVVGDDHRLEEPAASRDRDDRAPDTTRTDDEDPHRCSLANLRDPRRAVAWAERQPPGNFQSMVPVKQ